MKHLKVFVLLIILIVVCSLNAEAQTALHHTSDKGVYEFLDEMSANHVIDIRSVTKPYSRKQISDWLNEANKNSSLLTKTQLDRLHFWMNEFSMENSQFKEAKTYLLNKNGFSMHFLPPEVNYIDTSFRMISRPVYGVRYFRSTNVNFYNTYGGTEAIAYYGNHWAAWMSLRDYYQPDQRLASPGWLTREQGGNYKDISGGGSGGEYSEMRAGLTYSWKWGYMGLMKDHILWGDNQNGSNILSGRTPSFPMIKLYINPVRWLEFNYFHGWLVSQAIDSAASFFPPDGRPRTVQRKKYIAANMFTIKPWKRLHFSFGNSIVYGDMPVHPAFLIPFAFYKSFVHTINWGSSFQNNAMWVNISSRQIKHLHLYLSYFIDEFSIQRIKVPDRHNFVSFKGGFSLSDWPLRNIFLGAEYTRTNPITFLHDEPTTSFQSNLYNLGHYLTDNSEEYFATLRWYPIKTLILGVSLTHARKGNYYEYIRHQTNPRLDELPILDNIVWENKTLAFNATFYPISNTRIFINYIFSNTKGKDADGISAEDYLMMFGPDYLHGKTSTLELGFGIGF
jgi:hypothetical protein